MRNIYNTTFVIILDICKRNLSTLHGYFDKHLNIPGPDYTLDLFHNISFNIMMPLISFYVGS